MEIHDKEQIQQKFGEAVLAVMKEKDLSIRKLAASGQMEYAHVQRITKGKVNVSISTIIALCEGLEVSPEELFSHYK